MVAAETTQAEETHQGPEEGRSQTLTDPFTMTQDEKIVEFFRGHSLFYDQSNMDYRNKVRMDELLWDLLRVWGLNLVSVHFLSFILCHPLIQSERLTYK